MKTSPRLTIAALGSVILNSSVPSLQAQFNYASNGGAITITRYTGIDDTVTIPAAVNDLPVTEIGRGAFSV